MRIIAYAYDPLGNLKGGGPITDIEKVTVNQLLDGAGTVNLSINATNKRALDLLTNETRVAPYIEYVHGGELVALNSGIVREIRSTDSESAMFTFDGPDQLDELKRVSVRTNLQYNNSTIRAIAENLVSKVTGWSVYTHPDVENVTTTARFDTVSILKALQQLVKNQGLHFVLSGDRQITISAFGTQRSDIRIMNVTSAGPEFMANNNVGALKSFTMSQSSEMVANRVFVYGAGQNIDQALTLEQSTRGTGGGYPYDINTLVENSRTHYYLEDTASVAEYGVIEEFIQASEISPLTTSSGDVINAANAVYDFGAEWLQRYAVRQDTFSAIALKVRRMILPGDKVRIVNNRMVELGGQFGGSGQFFYRNIDDYFWVMSVATSISASGITTDLELSNVDVFAQDAARQIHGALEAINIRGVREAPTQNLFLFGPEQVFISTTESGTVELPLTDRTLDIDSVLMRVRTQPLTSTSVGEFEAAGSITTSSNGGQSLTTSSGGAHTHVVASYQDDTTGGTTRRLQVNRATGGVMDIYVPTTAADGIITAGISAAHDHSVTTSNHTHDVDISGSTFTLDYGIFRDTQYPGNMSISVNGTSITPSPVGSDSSAYDNTFDITDEIIAKAGGFQTTHSIDISCAAGQGEVLVTFDVTHRITPFKRT